MSKTQPAIVITDLDGTLLDHDTYQFDAALPALEHLKKTGIPLILSSSKTAAEIKKLRLLLNNDDPFVVENGAGIYLPVDHDYEKITFGMDRQAILSVLQEIRACEKWSFTGFNDMSIDDVVEKTGLERHHAQLAMQRDYTEPLQWQDTEQKLHLFIARLAASGLTAAQGGRFISISGKVDKGQALRWLRDHYQKKWRAQPVIIALGDSENDRQMLENADYAVLIRSPAHALPGIDAANLRITKEFGPVGWNSAVLELLEAITD